MAQPIPLELPARDPRAELQARLQNAPLEHAEALLAGYEVLQGLYDRGALELLRRGIRNGIILAKILGSIEPELVEGFAQALPEAYALTKAQESKPPGLWGLLKKFWNKDFLRGLLLATSTLEAVGRNLPPEK